MSFIFAYIFVKKILSLQLIHFFYILMNLLLLLVLLEPGLIKIVIIKLVIGEFTQRQSHL